MLKRLYRKLLYTEKTICEKCSAFYAECVRFYYDVSNVRTFKIHQLYLLNKKKKRKKMATVFVVEASDKQATMLKAKSTMEKDRLIQYYCSEDFLELYLGNFRICDRPKRMIYRFLSEENLLEDCETSSPVKPGIRPNNLFLFSSDKQQPLKMNIIKNKSPIKTKNNNDMIHRNDNKKNKLSDSFHIGKSNNKIKLL